MSRSRSLQMRRVLAGMAVLAAAAVIAGCGSSNKSSGGSSASSGGGYGSAPKTNSTAAPASSASGGQTVKLAADESGGLYFNPRKLSAKSGKVTLVMSDPKSSGLAHGIAVQGNGVDKDGPIVPAGSSSTVQVTLKPGRYTYYCPVKAHHAAGMQGTLVVQ